MNSPEASPPDTQALSTKYIDVIKSGRIPFSAFRKFDSKTVLRSLEGQFNLGPEGYKLPVKLNSDNFDEWKWYVNEFIENLSCSVSSMVQHYAEGKINLNYVHPSLSEYYNYSTEEERTEPLRKIEAYLTTMLTTNMEDSYRFSVKMASNFSEAMQAIEATFDPRYRKVCEIRSFKKRKVGPDLNFNTCIEHDKIYGSDWIVWAMVNTIDVDQYDNEELLQILEFMKVSRFREMFEKAQEPGVYLLAR